MIHAALTSTPERLPTRYRPTDRAAGTARRGSAGAFLSIVVNRDSSTPLFLQVYHQVREGIESGRIPVATRLPSSRQFAIELGVSRITITIAYEQLISEGYAEGHRGSAVLACNPAPVPRQEQNGGAITPRIPSMVQSYGKSIVDLGFPDMRSFPYKIWSRCITRAARDDLFELLPDAPILGDPQLRSEIARHLLEWRGLKVTAEQVIVTAGSGDALELILHTLTKSGDVVALENPGYPSLRRHVERLGLKPRYMHIDRQGAELPETLHGESPALTVLTPSHQFPLGGAMTLSRRNDFLKHAVSTSGWIVEDDYDSEFVYAGQRLPALASLPGRERVIYVGTFSKAFGSGLRLGYMVVPSQLLERFAASITLVGLTASAMAQRPLAMMIRDGELHRHLRTMRRLYSQRYAAFVAALRSELEGLATFTDHRAGMQLALYLPHHCCDAAVADAADRKGIACKPLSSYYATPDAAPGLLLGFCNTSPEDSAKVARTLRELVELHSAQPAARMRSVEKEAA